jgi:hypothetical protein
MKLTYSELAKIKTALIYFCENKTDFFGSELNQYVGIINKITAEQKKN